MQRLIGFGPTSEPVGERLSNLRITSIALVDKLDGWDGIDSWLETERTLGTSICRQVMEAAKLGDTVERRLENLDPLMSWAHALSSNLRHARSIGHDAGALAKLQTNAQGWSGSSTHVTAGHCCLRPIVGSSCWSGRLRLEAGREQPGVENRLHARPLAQRVSPPTGIMRSSLGLRS